MSTKNLARTVIEGGRHRVNVGFRRYSNRQERVAERQLSSRVARLEVLESAIYEPRQTVYPFFDDKLGPAKRWLRRQVGRPWDKVRGELMRRFDTRTTSGRHILFCHLIPSVQVDEVTPRYARYDFKVDRHGILRDVKARRRQGGELDEVEAARWRALPEWFREDWDAFKLERSEEPWLQR